METWGAVFQQTDLREICTNADEVIRGIKGVFPLETHESLARKAEVSFQTVQRWSSTGRADAAALRRLLTSFPAKQVKPGKRVYLDEANAKQLYDRCCALGWDIVIKAGNVSKG
jgi:hypothetical protein